MTRPRVGVLAGPDGAGKTTVSQALVRDRLGIARFVNADAIAFGLAGAASESVAVAAGRLMLARLDELTADRVDFAFETTLASRSFAPRLSELRQRGYELLLLFLWLPSASIARHRVSERVRAGGHDIPPDTIERRYQRGLRNFLELYRPLVDYWWCYNGSSVPPRLVAEGSADSLQIEAADTWQLVTRCNTDIRT